MFITVDLIRNFSRNDDSRTRMVTFQLHQRNELTDEFKNVYLKHQLPQFDFFKHYSVYFICSLREIVLRYDKLLM